MSGMNRFRFGLFLAVACATGTPPSGHALSTAFTYQGQLQQSGALANGTCDFFFSLYDAVSGGTQIGGTESVPAVVVTDGLFTVQLNTLDFFGPNAFTGADRWLEIAVRCPSGSGFSTTLSPRQRLTATPYALYTPMAGSASTATSLTCAGCVGANHLAAASITSQQIAPGTIQSSNLAFNPGTVTQINAGLGLTGGAITTTGTIAVDWGTTPGTVAEGSHTHDAAYWKLGGNSGTSPAADFVGTSDNQPLELHVNGQRALRLEPADSPNLVGGYTGNSVTSGVLGATIAGGGGSSNLNRVTDHNGTVSGGEDNQAGDAAGTVSDANFATVGGGAGNMAGGWGDTVGGGGVNQSSGYFSVISGGYNNAVSNSYTTVGGGERNSASAHHATVGGGFGNRAAAAFATVAGGGRTDENNTATGNLVTDAFGTIGGGGDNQAGNDNPDTADAVGATVGGGGANFATNAHATVGGGFFNFATGPQSAVGGGTTNLASGNVATVPGGFFNSAEGTGSFAAGVNAHAAHNGSFVWSDGTNSEASIGPNEFVARATGGFRFRYGSGPTDTCFLVNATGWHCGTIVSDRNVKANLAPVEGREVLTRLTSVPIQTWNYASQQPSVRHIGPMAQDFHAAFGMGEDDKRIDLVDANGVALAAIQGLYRLVQEKDAQIAALAARLTALERAQPRRVSNEMAQEER